MEAILIGLFGKLYLQYGLVGSISAVGALAAILILVRWLLARINLMLEDHKDSKEERMMELTARNQERETLIKEASAANAKTATFINNHLEHDRREREELAKTMSDVRMAMQSMTQTQGAISYDLKLHREEEGKRNAEIFDRLGRIN